MDAAAEAKAGAYVTEFLSTRVRRIDPSVPTAVDLALGAVADWLVAAAAGPTQITAPEARRAVELSDEMGRLRSILSGSVRIAVSIESQQAGGRQHFTFRFGDLISDEECLHLVQVCGMWTKGEAGTQLPWNLLLETISVTIDAWVRDAVPPAVAAIKELKSEIAGGGEVGVPEGVQALLLDDVSKRMEAMERESAKVLRSMRRQAGGVGEAGLTNAFKKSGDDATCGARIWSTGVFLCVLVGIVMPVWALHVDLDAFASVSALASVIIRGAVGLPLFALAAYCGHIAAQHRETSRHMDILSAQLESIENFSIELPDDERLELRMLMGKRTFSDPGLILRDKGKVGASADDLVELMKKVAEVLSAANKVK